MFESLFLFLSNVESKMSEHESGRLNLKVGFAISRFELKPAIGDFVEEDDDISGRAIVMAGSGFRNNFYFFC